MHLPKLTSVMLVCAVAAVSVVAGGCRPTPPYARPAKGSAFTSTTPDALAAARSQAMAAADTYMTVVAEAVDELITSTKRPEVRAWAMQQRVAAGLACCANASGANEYVALLDMMVLATLKRAAVEEHWIPTLLHDEGARLLERYRHGEADVWNLAARVVPENQRAELKRVIDEWRASHPRQYYVSHVRFTDFATAMRVTADSAQAHAPGSVFGMLYLDPLAGLDPVARELQQYRALTERLIFLANRMSIVLAWQVDLAVYRAMTGPEVVKFVDSTSRFADSSLRFADATTRFSGAVVKFPKDLTAERAAAVEQLDAATTRQVKTALEQVFAGVTEQRQAAMKEIEGQESRLRAVVSDVRGVVERADAAGRSVNAATADTIAVAEGSTRRTLNHAFLLAAGLVVLTLVALLLYRVATKRWAARGTP